MKEICILETNIATRIYDFHGIVRLKKISSQKQYIRFYDNE